MRIAIMQPYFLPYAGYFRLFSEADLFVIYDCVQFIRRGWIHRNRFLNMNGEFVWFTLPLEKGPQTLRISELRFPNNPQERLLEQQAKFPLFKEKNFLDSAFKQALTAFSLGPVNYLTQVLKLSCETLKLPFNIAYSSHLNLASDLKGQERIIAIAKHFNAKVYINPPNGRGLYNELDFKQHNMVLKFLPNYIGSYESVLPRILREDNQVFRKEIFSQGIDT